MSWILQLCSTSSQTLTSPHSPSIATPVAVPARRRWVRWGVTIGLLGILCLIGSVFRAWPGTLLNVGQPLHSAAGDFVFILPGNEDIRPQVAADLYWSGRVTKLIISVVPLLPDSVADLTNGAREIDLRVLQSRRIPTEDLIVLSATGETTFADMQVLLPVLEEHPSSTVLVLTNEYHTRRARWCARQVLGQASLRTVIVSAPNPGFTLEKWWRTPRGRGLVLWEWVKLVYYQLRYGSVGRWSLGLGFATALLMRCRGRQNDGERK